MGNKKRVLFLCTGNSARSQMAEGLLRHEGGDKFEAFSAGTHPAHVRTEAIEAMREIGIDISDHRSKAMEEFIGHHFDYVITVCDNANRHCPVFAGKTIRLHQGFEDPALSVGDNDLRMAVFRRVRDEIREWIKRFIAGPAQPTG